MKKIELQLFKGIAEQDILKMTGCLGAVTDRFEDGERVLDISENGDRAGIVLSGEVTVERIDENGNRTVLEVLGQNDIFGYGFNSSDSSSDGVFAVSRGSCEIMFLKYDRLSHQCSCACDCHARLVENLFSMMTARMHRLSSRLEVLSCRSTRQKLLSFFSLCSAQSGSPQFELPFSLTTLADYLCVDRSAMTRELKAMSNSGLIRYSGRNVELL